MEQQIWERWVFARFRPVLDPRRGLRLEPLAPLTQPEVASLLGISQVSVHRQERRALRKVLKGLNSVLTGPEMDAVEEMLKSMRP